MDSIFMQLWYAYASRQGGTVHVRNIITPLRDADQGAELTADFYTEADGNADMAPAVFAVVENAGLYLPERPAPVEPTPEPEPEPEPKPQPNPEETTN